MERDDWEDGSEFVEISVPTELVKRVISSISDVMYQWEKESKEKGEEFNALIGTAAAHLAVKFMDRMFEKMEGETIQ